VAQAEFIDANTLQLTRVTTTVQYHDLYKHGAPRRPLIMATFPPIGASTTHAFLQSCAC
jgi:hypothetical protein